MLFDTHLHLIYPEKLVYPWLKQIEALNMPSRYEEYEKIAQRVGIKGCLHMEVDVREDQIKEETLLINDLMLSSNRLIKGVISACRPENDDFPLLLEWIHNNPKIIGLRRVLHIMPDNLSQESNFRDNVKRLTGTGLTFDLCVSQRQLSITNDLVDHCPGVTFILDHCGVPDIKSGEFVDWKLKILELSKRENVFCKVSGLIAYGDPISWTLDDIRPYFEQVVSAFGHKRIIWGSDSPVCNLGGSLETWVAATQALCSEWPISEKNALFWENAHKIWEIA
jgi:predicted TIM-barrel fold metal-dependent hydrolase